MAHFSIHTRDTKAVLGDEFFKLHKWLDQLQRLFPFQMFGEYHRSFRHNSYGLAYCREMWGTVGELAFRIHIIRDYDDRAMFVLDAIHEYDFKPIVEMSNKALLFFNNLENLDLCFISPIYSSWEGKGYVHMADKEGLLYTYLEKWE